MVVVVALSHWYAVMQHERLASCFVEQAVQDRAVALLQRMVPILEQHRIDWWLEYGALLGVAREAGLVPWDRDIDLAVTEADEMRMVAVLNATSSTQLRVTAMEAVRGQHHS